MNLALKKNHRSKKSNSTWALDLEDDEDLFLLTIKLKRNIRKLGYGKGRRFKGKDKEKIVIYECKNPKCYKSKFLQLNKDKENKMQKKNISWQLGKIWTRLTPKLKKLTLDLW